MSGNKAVAYKAPGIVEIIDTPYPTLNYRPAPASIPSMSAGRCRTGSS